MSWTPDSQLKETIFDLVAVTIWTLYSFFYFFQFMFRFCCGTFFIEFSYIIIYGLSFKHVCWTLNHQNKLQYLLLSYNYVLFQCKSLHWVTPLHYIWHPLLEGLHRVSPSKRRHPFQGFDNSDFDYTILL